MYPYKMQMVQKLEHIDREQRMVFCEKMLTVIIHNNFLVSDVLFSDGAHFNLHGYVNHQNMWYYSETNPCEKPLLMSPYSWRR